MTWKTMAWRRLAPGLAALWLAGVSHAQGVSPRQLVEVADISHPTLSPDGALVAFRVERASIERNTHDTAWYVQRADGTAPARRVGEGGHLLRESDGFSLVPTPPVWSADGRHIHYLAQLDGRIEVWRAAADGSDARALTADPADVRRFRLGPDGRTLIYSVGATRREVTDAEQGEYDAGIRIDETVPIGQGLFRSGVLGGRPATQRLYGNDIIRSPLLANVPERWRALEIASGKVRDLSSAEAPSDVAVDDGLPGREVLMRAREAETGHVALLTQSGDGAGDTPPEMAVLVRLSGRDVRCRVDLCTGKPITAIQWRPGGDEVLFTLTDRDDSQAQSVFRWRIGAGDVLPVVRTSGLINGGRATPGALCDVSSDAMVCVAADAQRPPRLERIDLESGERTILFDPNAALATDMAGVKVERLSWHDAGGQRFNGLYYPARKQGDGPPPLFVTYYRCTGFVRGGVGDEWPLATLAGGGIATLCINAAPMPADAVTRFERARTGVESAIALLAARGEIDRSRVGMGGLSHGTEVTLWVAMNSDVLSAASVSSIAFSPLAHTLMSMSGPAFSDRLEKYWQLGTPDETPERWRQLSPVFNLERIKAPILMQLPEQEYLHSLDYAIPLIRDRRSDLYVYPNEAHQKFQPRHKLAVYQRNVDWFRFWLQGIEDADARKAGQYRHWRAMADRAEQPATDGGR